MRYCSSSLFFRVWALTDPYYGYFRLWQLVINIGTMIATFDGVLHPKNAKPRYDGNAIEARRIDQGSQGSPHQLVDLEALSDEELDALHKEFEKVRCRPGAKSSRRGNPETAV